MKTFTRGYLFIFLIVTSVPCFAEEKLEVLSKRVSELEKRINLLSYGLSKMSKSSTQPSESKDVKSSTTANSNEYESSPELNSQSLDIAFTDDLSVESGENNLEDYSNITEKHKAENYSGQNNAVPSDSSYSGRDNRNNGSYASTSNNGVIGAGYTGIGFLHAWNKDFDITHQEFYIQARNPLLEILDIKGNVEIAVSDIEGGPNQLYSDGWGNSFYLPKHNRWSVGASIGLDLHHEFSVSDGFSIDPFVGAALPLDYYFRTEYDVFSELRYGYGLSLGVEFLLFDSLSIIPLYKTTTYTYVREDGVSSTEDSRGSFNLTINYFFANSFLSFAYIHELDVNWRGLSFSYNLGY